jgi:hypothetical protein
MPGIPGNLVAATTELVAGIAGAEAFAQGGHTSGADRAKNAPESHSGVSESAISKQSQRGRDWQGR